MVVAVWRSLLVLMVLGTCCDAANTNNNRNNSNRNKNKNKNNDITHTQFAKFVSDTFLSATAPYNKYIFPREDLSDKMDIDMRLKLKAITDFNEVAGTLELIGILTIVWKDELVDNAYDNSVHGNFTEYLITHDYVWKPAVSLFNSAKAIVPVGDNSNMIRVEMLPSGFAEMTWNPGIITKTGCNVKVRDFPFDKQKCNVTFTPWGHPATEVEFVPKSLEVDLTEYDESSTWMLTDTTVMTEKLDGGSFQHFELSLTRRPTYFLLNMILPILILGILNAMAFLLPTESGERVGYSVTAFLTFAVYLTLIAQTLPRSSSPMALISFFLMSMVVVSSVASIITIFTLKVYFKDEDDPVPNSVANFVACLNCLMCKSEKDPEEELFGLADNEEHPDNVSVNSEVLKKEMTFIDDGKSTDSDTPKNKYGVDWKLVAGTLDMFSFIAVCGASAGIAVVFLVPLAAQM